MHNDVCGNPSRDLCTVRHGTHRFVSKVQQLLEELRLVQDFKIQLLRRDRLIKVVFRRLQFTPEAVWP